MSLLICALVVTFFGTIATGPAGLEVLEKRRARLDFPHVKQLAAGGCSVCGRATCPYRG